MEKSGPAEGYADSGVWPRVKGDVRGRPSARPSPTGASPSPAYVAALGRSPRGKGGRCPLVRPQGAVNRRVSFAPNGGSLASASAVPLAKEGTGSIGKGPPVLLIKATGGVDVPSSASRKGRLESRVAARTLL